MIDCWPCVCMYILYQNVSFMCAWRHVCCLIRSRDEIKNSQIKTLASVGEGQKVPELTQYYFHQITGILYISIPCTHTSNDYFFLPPSPLLCSPTLPSPDLRYCQMKYSLRLSASPEVADRRVKEGREGGGGC